MKLHLLPNNLLEAYRQEIDLELVNSYVNLEDSELSINEFSFYTSVSAVYSSKIEGEEIALDSYVKHKRFGINFLPDYTQKVDDLYNAYQFAKTNALNKSNIEFAHKIATKNILPEKEQGKTRRNLMYVLTDAGQIEYVAAQPDKIVDELNKFYFDLDHLLNTKLTIIETFFYAAMLHLIFVKIHPFNDGNGRSSRLIEKWFLAQKLGEKAWLIGSEKNYYENHNEYYKNLRILGLEYETLQYEKALPFLIMLPNSLKNKNQ